VGSRVGVADGLLGDADGLLGGAEVLGAEVVGVAVGDAPPVGAVSLHPTSPAATTNSPTTSLTLRR
jgi:hypothetical protein